MRQRQKVEVPPEIIAAIPPGFDYIWHDGTYWLALWTPVERDAEALAFLTAYVLASAEHPPE